MEFGDVAAGQTAISRDTFTIRVNGKAHVNPKSLTLTFRSETLPPVAQAGPDQAVSPGSVVQLDGSKSLSPEGRSLRYEWSVLSSPNNLRMPLSDSYAARPTFNPTALGVYVLGLTVTDGLVESAQDTVTIRAGAIATGCGSHCQGWGARGASSEGTGADRTVSHCGRTTGRLFPAAREQGDHHLCRCARTRFHRGPGGRVRSGTACEQRRHSFDRHQCCERASCLRRPAVRLGRGRRGRYV